MRMEPSQGAWHTEGALMCSSFPFLPVLWLTELKQEEGSAHPSSAPSPICCDFVKPTREAKICAGLVNFLLG